MYKKIFISLFILIVINVLLSRQAFSETKFKYGFSERMRNEYLKNWKDMDNNQADNRNYFRFRTSLWCQMEYDKNFSLYARFTNEFKAYSYFAGTSGSVPDKTANKKGYHFGINEVVFDNLYADMKSVLDLPLDLRLGRQDFIGTYGEGFLIMDGTPQDGSRTHYFNAAKATWHLDEKHDLDFIYINNPRDEEFLPVINRLSLPSAANPNLDKAQQVLNTTDEQAGALYFRNKAIKNLLFEPYYIFKKEAEEGGGAGYQSQKGKINAIGSFAKYDIFPFTLRTQLALQFGDYGSNDRSGYGGYGFLDRSFKDAKFSPRLSGGFVYLSGDKKSSGRNEGWDPLFSRWTWLSDLYFNTMSGETGISGYWTNLQIYRLELTLNTTKKTKFYLNYNYLRANTQVAASSIFSGNGKERGHLPQAKLDYKISDNVTAYFLAEYLKPGNFYEDNDPAIFLRTEVQIKF